MRIDKYLKVTRIIKRRELAKEMINKGLISINGKTAKPASEIKVDDQVSIVSPSGKTIRFKVLALASYSTAEGAGELYQMEETPNKEEKKA